MDDEEKHGPDWDSFESYKGPTDECGMPGWCQWIFHAFMILLVAAIVFAVSGGLYFLACSRITHIALSETPASAWSRFITGGCIGLAATASWHFRKGW